MDEILISIIDNMEKGIVFIDEYHTIWYLNKAAKSYYEGKNLRELVGRSVLEFHGDKTKQKIKEAVRKFAEDNTLNKIVVGKTTLYAVRTQEYRRGGKLDIFRGYYQIFDV